MSEQERDVDLICTAVGGIIVIALAAYLVVMSMQGTQIGWKMPAVVGGIGIVLMLPFRQLQKLLGTVSSQLPFGGE